MTEKTFLPFAFNTSCAAWFCMMVPPHSLKSYMFGSLNQLFTFIDKVKDETFPSVISKSLSGSVTVK